MTRERLDTMTVKKHPDHDGFVIFESVKSTKRKIPRWMKISAPHSDSTGKNAVWDVQIAWWYVLWLKLKHFLKR